MNPHQKLAQLARAFDLKYHERKYTYLVCTKGEIVIRNFLAGCPDPLYANFQKNKARHQALTNFFHSAAYQKELRKPHGCVIHRPELKRELSGIDKIENQQLRQKVQRLYLRIQRKMSKNQKLSLIWKASGSEKRMKDEVILHEFVHELLEDNQLRPGSWKWNEGLATYLTHFALGRHRTFERNPRPTGREMWDIYANYSHKWALLLKGKIDPAERRRIITKKVRDTKRKNKSKARIQQL